MKTKEKQIASTKKWTIEQVTYDDGSVRLNRTNDGFSIFELFGLLKITELDIVEQAKGIVKPDIIKRTVIKP